MRTLNNHPPVLSISATLNANGFDSCLVAEFIDSSLSNQWEYYDLIKSTLSRSEKEQFLMKLCLIQNLLCSIRATSQS